MAININITNENKYRVFDNNAGRRFTAASCISLMVDAANPPKIPPISLEFAKDKFWKQILAIEYLPVTNRRLLHVNVQDKTCFLSIFPDYAGVYLNSKNRLEVFRRGENDTFKKAIENLKITTPGSEKRPLVAINSAYFTVPDSLYYTAYSVGAFIKYSNIKPNGRVVHNGAIFNTNSVPSPLGFHISYTFNGQQASQFSFAAGEALLSGDGVGASTPILIFNSTYNKVWKYGNKNTYQPGHAGPEEGDPGAFGQFLLTRNNPQYRLQNERASEGKNIIAYCKSKDLLLIITVPEDSPNGRILDYYRDHLFRLGFENAIAVDGSTSVVKYTYSNKKYYAYPDERKNNSIPLGFIFYI